MAAEVALPPPPLKVDAPAPPDGPPPEVVIKAAAGAKNAEGELQKFENLVRCLKIARRNRERCLIACLNLEMALRPTSSQQPLFAQALAAGSVEAIVEAMSAQRGAVEVQMVACQALQHVSAASADGGATRVAASGGCQAVVIAIGAHSTDVLLLQAAAQALELIAFGGSTSRERAVEDGAVEALLGVMKAHRHVQPVQQAALAALQTLVEKQPDCQQAERVAAAGGIAAVVTSLGDSKTNRQIQYWGRMLLQNLCAENRDLRAEAIRKLHYQGIEIDF